MTCKARMGSTTVAARRTAAAAAAAARHGSAVAATARPRRVTVRTTVSAIGIGMGGVLGTMQATNGVGRSGLSSPSAARLVAVMTVGSVITHLPGTARHLAWRGRTAGVETCVTGCLLYKSKKIHMTGITTTPAIGATTGRCHRRRRRTRMVGATTTGPGRTGRAVSRVRRTGTSGGVVGAVAGAVVGAVVGGMTTMAGAHMARRAHGAMIGACTRVKKRKASCHHPRAMALALAHAETAAVTTTKAGNTHRTRSRTAGAVAAGAVQVRGTGAAAPRRAAVPVAAASAGATPAPLHRRRSARPRLRRRLRSQHPGLRSQSQFWNG